MTKNIANGSPMSTIVYPIANIHVPHRVWMAFSKIGSPRWKRLCCHWTNYWNGENGIHCQSTKVVAIVDDGDRVRHNDYRLVSDRSIGDVFGRHCRQWRSLKHLLIPLPIGHLFVKTYFMICHFLGTETINMFDENVWLFWYDIWTKS